MSQKSCPYCGGKVKRKEFFCSFCSKPIKNEIDYLSFKINSRNLKLYTFIVSWIGIIWFGTTLILALSISFSSLLSLLFFGFLIMAFCALMYTFIDIFGIVKTEIIITSEIIKISFFSSFKKVEYFEISWSQLKTIEIVEELHEVQGRYGTSIYKGYMLVFKAKNIFVEYKDIGYQKNIRLWCCRFTKAQQKKIVSIFNEYCKIKNIEVKNIPSSQEIKTKKEDCEEILSFKEEEFPGRA